MSTSIYAIRACNYPDGDPETGTSYPLSRGAFGYDGGYSFITVPR